MVPVLIKCLLPVKEIIPLKQCDSPYCHTPNKMHFYAIERITCISDFMPNKVSGLDSEQQLALAFFSGRNGVFILSFS